MTTVHEHVPVPGVLTVDVDGAAEWWSARVAAVGLVEVVVGDSCTVRVDSSRPAVVLGWTVGAGADPDPLGRAVANMALAELITSLRGNGKSVQIVDGPVLAEPFEHLAAVTAVARWTLRPVNAGALLLDRAVAAEMVGNRGEAWRLFSYAEDALLDFAEMCLQKGGSSAIGDRLVAALAAAQTCGLDGPYIDGLLAQLEQWSPIADADLVKAFSDWRNAEVVGAVGAATDMGNGPSGGDPDLFVTTSYLDIEAIPPRVIAWEGAAKPELLIEYHRAQDRAIVTASLAAGVDAVSQEVRQLFAYLCDKETGRVVATAPMTVTGGSVSANLPGMGLTVDQLYAGLFKTGVRIESLRTDPVGRCLAEVDRHMVDAWGHARSAVAVGFTLPPTAYDAKRRVAMRTRATQLRMAQTAAQNASTLLTREIEARGDSDADSEAVNALLRARLDAVEEFVEDLGNFAAAQGHLLLTELIAPDPDDE
ncbi:hypothetical protein [Antrihabitans spumae]|uniref:Uncharacterized protein n=1 Tax=Antrihabitans spumae TaxID=3373370 RepID=A0ABW7K711_9NOCA